MTIFREYSKKLLCSAVALAMVGSVITITPEARAGSRNAIIGFGVGLLVGGIIASKHKRSRRAKSRRVIRRKAVRRNTRARTRTRRTQNRPRTVARAVAPVNRVSRSEMMQMQSALAVLGMYTITIDGMGGPGTRNAIRIFQAEQGFPRTGRLNEEQKSHLYALADRKNYPPTIEDGAPANTSNKIVNVPVQGTQTVRTTPPVAPVVQPPVAPAAQPAAPVLQANDLPANNDQEEVTIFSANEVDTTAEEVTTAKKSTKPAPKVNARDLAAVFDSDDELLLRDDQLVLAE
jgi:peptidoglycan hydrolase-like protein with peptidoglycan-binding domain